MAITEYHPDLHTVSICDHCQGKGKKWIWECKDCMGVGFVVLSSGTQIKNRNMARSIVVSLARQYMEQQQEKTNVPPLKYTPPITDEQTQSPPYNPWTAPNSPWNPNNPYGLTHPFSPNNPFWKNSPANPNSIMHPNHPMNPHKPIK